MQAILNIAVRAARKAGAHLVRERLRYGHNLTEKQLSTLLGQAETMISEIVQTAYKDHTVRLADQPDTDDQETVWQLSIVDGFENFVRGISHYALAMLIEEKGKPKYALIYDPVIEEIYTATKGSGARCNDERIRVNTVKSLEQLAVGCVDVDVPDSVESYYFGSCLLTMLQVAAGRLDAFVAAGLTEYETKLSSFFLKEAGAISGNLAGEPVLNAQGELMAANPKLFKQLVGLNQSE